MTAARCVSVRSGRCLVRTYRSDATLHNTGTPRTRAALKYSMWPWCSGSNAPSTIATWPRYCTSSSNERITAAPRQSPEPRVQSPASRQQPFLLQLVERLVEEVHGHVRRGLRPVHQLAESLL